MCKKHYQNSWQNKNPEKKKEANAKYRQKNALKHAEYNKQWFVDNKSKASSYAMKRYATIRNRTPRWLTEDDHWMMEQAYDLAKLRTEIFGFKWHVDHIIPLQGRKVSGFHVPTNLQVIPMSMNCSKGNSFTV
jgi:hypothetical protein